jgi:hypothetical protein
MTCSGSQAETLTNQYQRNGYYFSTFTPGTASGDTVPADGTMYQNGNLVNWSATFYITDGGTLGRCIDRIVVTQGN